jgi:hypothetical protein
VRQFDELTNVDDPAFPLVRESAAAAIRPVEFLPPSDTRGCLACDALACEPCSRDRSRRQPALNNAKRTATLFVALLQLEGDGEIVGQP